MKSEADDSPSTAWPSAARLARMAYATTGAQLRQMQVGERFFFYHSAVPEPGLAGSQQGVRTAYPTPPPATRRVPITTPRCLRGKTLVSRRGRFRHPFPALLSLRQLRARPIRQRSPTWALLRRGQSPVSVPVSSDWQALTAWPTFRQVDAHQRAVDCSTILRAQSTSRNGAVSRPAAAL